MFNTFNKILKNEEITREEAENTEIFILLRWLSGNANLAFLANNLNFYNLDKFTILNVLSKNIKGIKFIKYPKTEKTKSFDFIKALCDYYQISVKDAIEYSGLISENDIKEIKKYLKLNNFKGI